MRGTSRLWRGRSGRASSRRQAGGVGGWVGGYVGGWVVVVVGGGGCCGGVVALRTCWSGMLLGRTFGAAEGQQRGGCGAAVSQQPLLVADFHNRLL